MAGSESRRPKFECVGCNNVKPIKNLQKSFCQNCWHKEKRKYRLGFYVSTRYTEVKQRCTNPNNKRADYYGGKEFCSREEFESWALACPSLPVLYKQWQESNFDNKFAPSVDRINPEGGYTLGNMRWVTHSDNCRMQTTRIPVTIMHLDTKETKSFESINDAVRYCDVQQANAWKVLIGERKHTKRWVFLYAN